jgi:signal transduction histidine kinase
MGLSEGIASPASGGPAPWLLLIDAIERLSGAAALDEVVAIVRSAARRIAGADGATFVLRAGERCHYVDEDAIGPLWKGQTFPLSACISGWAMLNRQTAVVPDIYEDARIPHDAYRPTFVKSLVMVPVRQSDPLAAIGLYWADRHRPEADELTRLESLARATATAIANVGLKVSLSEAAEAAQAQAAEIGSLYEQTRREQDNRLKVEAQLHHSQKMEAIGNLTGGLAHDFNNLLGIIVGSLDLLAEEEALSASGEELVAEATDAVLRGADLTRRLLAFARQQPLEPRRIDVNELVAGMFKLLTRILGERVRVELELAPAVWPVVADPAQLEAALANLSTNARDAMPRGGRLGVVTGNRSLDADYAALHPDVRPGDYVMIQVSDSGTGMAPEVLSRIFEPFFTTKEAGRGTGLGLAMVFGFMKQSGGHINVYSEVGHGTTFRLYLPRGDAAPAVAAADRAGGAAGPEGRGELVLAIEDNVNARRILVRQLESLGYRAIEAETGDEALALLRQARVDLLLSDIVMPGAVDGLELAEEARRLHPTLKVLMMSGFPGSAFNAGKGLPEGLRLLSKPYRKDELARAVREVLEG